MAAGDPMAFTNSPEVTQNTIFTLTAVAADQDSANGTQVFNFTPAKKKGKALIIFNNTTGTATFSIAAGVGAMAAGAAKTGSMVAGLTAIRIETGRYASSAGVIAITVTPAAGTKLLTNHALKVYVAELL